MSVRRDSDHRPPGSPQGRFGPPIWEKRIPALPPPGPEERGGHRPSRSERNRQDHVRQPSERRSRAQSWPLQEKEGLLGRSPRLLRRNGTARLPGEDCEQETHDGDQAAIRGQAEQSLLRPSERPPDQDRSPWSAARALRLLELDSFLDRDISQLSGGE